MVDGESLAILLIFAIIYMFPALVALLRWRTNVAAIFILNLLAGWSIIFWIVALMWAVSHDSVKYQKTIREGQTK